MARIGTTLLFFWALLVGPALCASGLLEHPCECDSEVHCQHEEACSDDPCAPIVRPDEPNAPDGLRYEAAPSPASVTARSVEATAPAYSWRSRPPRSPRRSNLPYEQSDRPLLI